MQPTFQAFATSSPTSSSAQPTSQVDKFGGLLPPEWRIDGMVPFQTYYQRVGDTFALYLFQGIAGTNTGWVDSGFGASTGGIGAVLEVHAAPAVPEDTSIPFPVVRYTNESHNNIFALGYWSPTAADYVSSLGNLKA